MKDYLTRRRAIEKRIVRAERDSSTAADGYSLTVSGDGTVLLTYSNERGLRYGERALAAWEQKGLQVGVLTETPDFELRGLIEGFYGRPYTWAQRRDAIRFLDECRYNTYFYAPKDDPYHRDRWREAYPQTLLDEIARLARFAGERCVDFYYCIAPGKDFRFCERSDYLALIAKLRAVRDAGVRNFALLLDDIDPTLGEADAAAFASAGAAHAHLIDFCVREVASERPWLFCPTEYMQNFDTAYRADFRAAAQTDFRVFWTGYNTVAEVVTAEDGETVRRSFGRELVLWDNYPVNDYEPKRRLYFGAVRNRSARLVETHVGYVVNPMPQWEASKFALVSAAAYCWHSASYDADAEERAACRLLAPKAAQAAETLVARNRCTGFCLPSISIERYERENWAWLDAAYRQSESAAMRLKETMSSAQLAEFAELLDYLCAEARFYRAVRAGTATHAQAEALAAMPWRAQDQAVLEYYNRLFPATAVEPEREREIWWKLEGEKS